MNGLRHLDPFLCKKDFEEKYLEELGLQMQGPAEFLHKKTSTEIFDKDLNSLDFDW